MAEVVDQWETTSLNNRHIVIKHEREMNYAKRLVDVIKVYEYLDNKLVGIGKVEVH